MLALAEIAILALAMQGENFAVMCERLLKFYNEEEIPIKAIGFI